MFNAFCNFITMHLIWPCERFEEHYVGNDQISIIIETIKRSVTNSLRDRCFQSLTYALMPYEMIYHQKRSLTMKIYVLSANSLTHACWLIAWLKSDHVLMKFQEHLAMFSSMHSKMHYTVSSFKVALSIGLISSC